MTLTLKDVLSCPALPTLPAVAVRLLELTRDPDVVVKDIASLVQQDQALAARVLRTINSSYYSLSSPCGSLERAIAMLGLETVKSLVLGFSLIDTTRTAGDSGFDLQAHWRRSLHGAVASRELAIRQETADPDEAFTAGLFQDVGVLALYLSCGDQYSRILADAAPGLHGICATERSVLGLDHAQVSSALAERWRLPESITRAIAGHHRDPGDGADLVTMVARGRLAAEALAAGAAPSVMREFISQTARRHKDPQSIIEAIIESTSTLASMFEVDVGDLPSVESIMANAQDLAFELQIQTQRRAEQFQTEAQTDALTGVSNRARFDALLSEHARGLAVVFFDADKFKSINDTHGHAAGDAVLVEIAGRLQEITGDQGFVCRYGGEEFALLLPETSLSAAMDLAERARVAIESSPFDTSSVEGAPDSIRVTVSAGVGVDDGTLTPEQVVAAADKAVYASKRNGRNRVTGPNGAAADGKPRIAVIEDDPLAATLLKSLLVRKCDATCEIVASGKVAQSLMKDTWPTNPPSIIIVESTLPDATAEELLRDRAANQSLTGIPVVVMATVPEPDLEKRMLDLGAAQVVLKSQICERPNVVLEQIHSLLQPAQAA